MNRCRETGKAEFQLSTLNSQHATDSFSIYLHIPFCRNLCPFCHFYRVPDVPDWNLYLKALSRELAIVGDQAVGRPRTLYVGGGTPTVMPPDFYREFFRLLSDRFELSALVEATIETDGDVAAEDLARLAETGFNRISFGIKSFNARTRNALRIGRPVIQDPVAVARRAGFSSVGLDFVYGVRGQTVREMVFDVETAVDLGPDHISLYDLEENGDVNPRHGDQDVSAEMFRESMRVVRQAGFRQYEITNFSRPGHRSVHNSGYWRDGDYFGLGPSAHGSMTRNAVRIRWRNLPDVSAYMENPARCRREISREDGIIRAGEALILGLRMTQGVERAPFLLRYGIDPVELIRPFNRYFIRQGLLRVGSQRVRLTTRGMLLSNEVFVHII